MSNYQRIYDRLRRAGFTDAAALGFLGNWEKESGCEPNRLEGDVSQYRNSSKAYAAAVTEGRISRAEFGSDQKGFGLAQWTFVDAARTAGRKFNLFDFWKQAGTALDDLDMQIDFALHELSHDYAHVKTELAGASDLYTCVSVICRKYEQPAYNNIGERFQAAQLIKEQIDREAWQKEDADPPETTETGDKPMTKDEAIGRVLAIARREIGYREKNSAAGLDDPEANAGPGNWTKYARDLDRIPGFYNGPKQGFAWCDVFYDWLIVATFGPAAAQKLLCQPPDSAGAGCLYSAQYFRSAGQFHDKDPQPGDQVFFTYQYGEVSHTGIVEQVSGGVITTIEGNASDAVCRKSYAVGASVIYGYGRPDWSIVSTVSGPDTGGGSSPTSSIPGTGVEYQITLRELKEGDTGTPVERLQTLLIGRGYYCGGRRYNGIEQPDGEFGPATTVAVKDVQLANRLTQDGIVGSGTMAALLTK